MRDGRSFGQESTITQLRFPATSAAASAFGLVLLALPSYAQTNTSTKTPNIEKATPTTRLAAAQPRPRQHHALLADEHRGFVGPVLLGKQARLFRPETCRHPGGREHPSG
jgi:hypothetical protein